MSPRLVRCLALVALSCEFLGSSSALRLPGPSSRGEGESSEAQRRAEATAEQLAKLSRDDRLQWCIQGVQAALDHSLHFEMPGGVSRQLAMTAGVCANPDRLSQVSSAVRVHEASTSRGHGCLPEDEDYSDEDLDIQVEAATDLMAQRVVEDLCGTEPARTSIAPWPEQCPRELANFIRSHGNTKQAYEALCPGSAEDHAGAVGKLVDRVLELPLGFSVPCYEHLAEVLKLEPQLKSTTILALGSSTVDLLCQRSGPKLPSQERMTCEAAQTDEVERCGNELLKLMESHAEAKVMRWACSHSKQDLARGISSGATLLQDEFLGFARQPPKNLNWAGVSRACGGLGDLTTIAASVAAAFPCACLDPAQTQLPSRKASDEADPSATTALELGVGSGIATAAAERPKKLREIMELAHYPVYKDGPLGHMVWPWHRDERFDRLHAVSDPATTFRLAYQEVLRSSRNPEVLRLFRFAYNERLGNSNVGDLAHVCAWGQCNGPDCQDLLKGYKLYIYSVWTDGTRSGYSKCNRNECAGPADRFGFRYKFLESKNGCYDGPSSWYSLPARAEGKSWKMLSLDRVVEWSCIFNSGLYTRGLSSEGLFQELDRILFSLEGCGMCPDVEAPHNSSHRVCPSSV